MPTISACIIARDEEARLPACLASLAFCDEIVLVDSGSSDATMEIARSAGARVFEHEWQGFAVQRNVAMRHATSDWVIEVDADEVVTPELARELRAFLSSATDGHALGMLPMRHRFLGRLLGPSGHYPFHRPRLIRRGAYEHDESREVHEGLRPRERPWLARHDMHHLLAGSFREAFGDAWTYARLEALQLDGPPASWLKAMVLRPAVKLGYGLVVLGGWRDGWQGVTKLSLDAGADVVVWLRYLLSGRWRSAEPNARHFGADPPAEGPARFVAVGRADSVREARPWLEACSAAGAWVTVISDADGPVVDRRVKRIGPIRLLRALDAERQAAPIETVVPLDARSRRAVSLVPPNMRPGPEVAPGDAPGDVISRLRAAR